MPFEHGWLAQRFICIGAAITDLQPGKMVIVVDDVDCENVSGRSKPATSGRIKTSHFEVR